MDKNVIFWEGNSKERFVFDEKPIIVTDKKYLFSLVVALYNSEAYIEETIESIIRQDIGFEENVQLIIVDDGSSDNSFLICKSYAEKFPENIILIHKKNGGVSSARNVGMRFAVGEFINFIDSDDKFSIDVCRKVRDFFNKNLNKVDVVTIKNELFGVKSGDSWFNRKFDRGNRVINLWREPQVYLNSTNCSFFHKRIRNQLHFDEGISIAEDLKLVNFVLMNKWALGVLSDCKYYYRIREQEKGSLAGTARTKEYYYIPYLEKVFNFLYKTAVKRCGFFPDFLQYTLFRDLWNRFNNNKECAKVLQTQEKIQEYKKMLFAALSCIDDRIIMNNSFLRSDEQVYFLSIKHGRPVLAADNRKVVFEWESYGISIKKSLYGCFEKATVIGDELQLEGYVVINNVHYPLSSYHINCRCGDNDVQIREILETSNDYIAFADEIILQRRYFRIVINVKSQEKNAIELYLNFFGINYPISIYGYGKWFALSNKFEHEFFEERGIYLEICNGSLVTYKCKNFLRKVGYEIRFLKELNDKDFKNILKRRLAYIAGKVIKIREIWIVSDRKNAAGDNGEAFYEYLKKKWHINSYFAIQKRSCDYKRLKRKGNSLLNLDSKYYKLQFLLADKLISAHFDGIELMPFATDGLRDIIAKKEFIFLQHGITKDDVSEFYSRKRQNLDMFVTSATLEYDSLIANPNYFCDETVTKLTGLPRYDKLYDNKQKIILIMPTWRKEMRNGNKFDEEKFKNSYYYKFYHALLTNTKLREYANAKGYKICYFAHSNIIESNKYMSDIEGIFIPNDKERKYTKAFAEASIMVTDYSSTAFDFSYLRKPVIYCQGDRDDFFAHHTYKSGYYDYKRDGLGPITYSVEEAVDEIVKAIENDCVVSREYLSRINSFFPFQDKQNCKRVYEAIIGLKKGESAHE